MAESLSILINTFLEQSLEQSHPQYGKYQPQDEADHKDKE